MIRFIGSVLLFSTLSMAVPFPFPAAPVVPPITVASTAYPFVPGPTPLVPAAFPFAQRPTSVVPGVNSPYYNYAGAPAVPIVSYSSEHGLDGTYAFRYVL